MRPILIMDPGHGGDTPVGKSTPNNTLGPAVEKHLALEVSRRVASRLGGFADVRLTRQGDTNLALGARADLARVSGAAAFVSLHFGADRDPQRQGTGTWVHASAGPASERLGRSIQAAVRGVTGHPDEGLGRYELAVLDPARLGAQVPACLVEVSYLTDPREARRLQDPQYLDRIADAVAYGVREHLDAGPAPRRRVGTGGVKRALVVGVDDYSATTAPSLGSCLADARGFRDLLTNWFQFDAANVHVLTNAAASASAILAGLRTLQGQSQAGDVLCFFFSGHGAYDVENRGTPSQRAYQSLFCADGREIKDLDLARIARDLADGVNFTVICDSCHSAGLGEAAGVPDTAAGARPLPPELGMGAEIDVCPVGVCITEGSYTEKMRVDNRRNICEVRQNTTVVPYARATLFAAADYWTTADSGAVMSPFTEAIVNVVHNWGTSGTLSCQDLQRGVVERLVAASRPQPMLRGQRARIDQLFLACFDSSEYGARSGGGYGTGTAAGRTLARYGGIELVNATLFPGMEAVAVAGPEHFPDGMSSGTSWKMRSLDPGAWDSAWVNTRLNAIGISWSAAWERVSADLLVTLRDREGARDLGVVRLRLARGSAEEPEQLGGIVIRGFPQRAAGGLLDRVDFEVHWNPDTSGNEGLYIQEWR